MRLLVFIATAMLTLPLVAQEKSSWIASRFSSDLMEITPSGSVLRRIDMGVNLRTAEVNPTDGMIWALQIFNGNFFIVNPVTAAINGPFTHPGGAGRIAFDAAGHAWMPGGTDIVEFDAAGAVLNTYSLGFGSAIGISIDNNGNKWIAHRVSPGVVTRVAPGGAVTNFNVTADQPVGCIVDYRLGSDSHIWVTTDSGASLLELDQTGTELNSYVMPSTTIGISPVITGFIVAGGGGTGRIWVGSFGGDGLFEFDPYANGSGPSDGAVVNTYAISNSDGSYQRINGLSVDTLGRVLCTQRVNFNTIGGPPCEIQRVNPATGAVEVPIVLTIGGANARGSQTSVSSAYQWSLVVAPLADTDLDGESNTAEILQGTSPLDATSNSDFSVDTTGTTSIGSTPSINIQGSSAWVIAFSDGLVCPGSPVPGFLGNLMLTSLINTIAGTGTASLPVAIPNNAVLQGLEFHIQGVIVTPALQLEFRNVTGLVIW